MAGGGEGKGAQDRSTCKVSLERYRQASAEVMAIIQQYSTVVEKASVDEAYVAFRPADLPGLVEGMDTDEHEEEGQEAQALAQDTGKRHFAQWQGLHQQNGYGSSEVELEAGVEHVSPADIFSFRRMVCRGLQNWRRAGSVRRSWWAWRVTAWTRARAPTSP